MKTELSKLMEKYRNYTNKELVSMLDEETDPKEFGPLLSYMRRHFLGFTQEDLSERLNVSRGHILNMEAGRTGPSVKLRKKIVHIFNIQFGFEQKDLEDNLFLAIKPESDDDISKEKIKEIYEQIKTRDFNNLKDDVLSYLSSPGTKMGGKQTIEPLEGDSAPFVMEPAIVDANDRILIGLKSYIYKKEDENCEYCMPFDNLIINPERLCGTKEDLFLFKNTDEGNHFVGRIFLEPDKNGIPSATVTIIHSYRYIFELKNKKLEEPVKSACRCLGQIVRISRDVQSLNLELP